MIMQERLFEDLSLVSRAARFPNLSAAATRIGISQPQLSRVVSRLEKSTGITLLDRSSRRGFRGEVLDALEGVPYGETVTYGELAGMAGRPLASRAVGTAMATNPLPVVVPCHRVLAAGGRLGGYGPGLALKERLLRMEGAWPVP